jgi:hypothetical protein
MAFHNGGWRTLGAMGIPSATAVTGEVRCLHSFVTNDDRAAIETANYFDTILSQVKKGDLLLVSYDVDGLEGQKMYTLDVVSSHVTLNGSNLPGSGLQLVPFYMNMAEIAAGDLMTNYVPGFNGKIEEVYWVQMKAVTTAAKLASINLEIGTTDLTGGVVALTSALCTPQGVKVAGSAVTANNVFTATDAISIEASAVTAFVEGSGWLILKLRNLDTN